MTFDLELGPAPPAPGALAAWAATQPGFVLPRGPGPLQYRNPATGVFVRLEERAGEGPVARLNLMRPPGVAWEAVPLVCALARALGLGIRDRHGAAPDAFAPPDPRALIASWKAANRARVAAQRVALAGRGPLPLALSQYLPEDMAYAWWAYQRQRDALGRHLGPEVRVPTPLLLKPAAGRRLVVAVTWSDGGPLALPPVDLVVLLRGVRAGGAEESGLAHGHEVVAGLGPWLRELAFGPPGPEDQEPLRVRVLDPDKVPFAKAWFMAQELAGGLDSFEEVAPDAFTAVPPAA